MSDARQRILARLRANRPLQAGPRPGYSPPTIADRESRIARFSERMLAVRAEVHRLPRNGIASWLREQLPARGLQRVLLGSGARADNLAAGLAGSVDVRRYVQEIEQWKAELFNEVDAAITGTRCGIAETGTLVLWPDGDEPRLMSLVPPVHIAVLEADRLYASFAAVIAAERWAEGMPTNALLVSGPSKTADIEQTLAFGIHGPKELIVLIQDD